LNGKTRARSLRSVLVGIALLLLMFMGSGSVKAELAADYPAVRVNRVIQIEDGGALVVNDTFTLSSAAGKTVRPLNGFDVGLTPAHRNALAYFFAYDTAGRLQTGMGVAADGDGFSWVNVSFPQPIDVSNGERYDFTLVFVFSGLVSANQTFVRADFPAYPILAREVGFCNVTVMLPQGAEFNSTSSPFVNMTIDSRQILHSERAPLAPFSSISSWVQFKAPNFMLLRIDEWRREIQIDGLGGLTATDYYQVVNKGERSLLRISFVLPANASGVSVQDVYGTLTGVTVRDRGGFVEANITLRELLTKGQKVKLLVAYKLPFWRYVAQRGWQDYMINVSLSRPNDWILNMYAVTVSLPEGGELQASSKTPYQLEREGFLVRVKFAEVNVTRFHEASINLQYRYLILWASFRPTLWVGTVAVLIGAVFFIRRTPKPEAVVAVSLSTGVLRRFIDVYEDRRRLRSELESLEQQVQKGKISRRRYRLQKSSLDGRLSKLQKDLSELKGEIAAAGGRYSERMRQLETAETEIETLDRDIERVEIRYQRKEISSEARRRLLDEYSRIKERAENTIEEILLRLQEEIR